MIIGRPVSRAQERNPDTTLIIDLDEIISAILPADEIEDIPSSFTLTGHIGKCLLGVSYGRYLSMTGHINLREEWLPYKNLIGQVILDVSLL